MCFSCFGYGQDIPKLTIPSTPAFSILDFEPTSVLRPSNAKAFAPKPHSKWSKYEKVQNVRSRKPKDTGNTLLISFLAANKNCRCPYSSRSNAQSSSRGGNIAVGH
ncbi:hypothetical protein ABIB62_002306 [Mucilaginibacter sp. UYP25]